MADEQYGDYGHNFFKALMRGWNASLGRWIPLSVDASGNLVTAANGVIAQGSGTFSLVDNLNEQTVFSVTASEPSKVYVESVDLTSLTQDNTVRVKLDAVEIDELAWLVASSPKGVYFRGVAVSTGVVFSVTVQAGGVEGAARDVAYRWIALRP